MSATKIIILGSSSPPIANSRSQSNEESYHETLLHSDASLPLPSTLLRIAPKAPPKTGSALLRSGSRAASVPTGASGFCTASAFAKEHGLGTASALNLQKYVNGGDDVPGADIRGDLEKTTATKRKTTKKATEPKLKLDKKPTERKPRKKKGIAEAGDSARVQPEEQSHSTVSANLQEFEYKAQDDESKEEGKTTKTGQLKSVTRKPRLQVTAVSEPAEHRPPRDTTPASLQILEYKPEEQDIAGDTEGSKFMAKPRKSRAKKSDNERNQAKLPKAKVTKPRARKTKTTDTPAEAQREQPEVVPDMQEPPQDGEVLQMDVIGSETAPLHEDLALEPAIRRRRDWTPPRAVEVVPIQPEEDRGRADSEEAAFQTQREGPTRVISNAFLDLHGSFGYTEQAKRDEVLLTTTTSTEPALKKRRVEVIKATSTKTKSKTSPAPKAPKPPKASKAAPKSARTVTGMVLAQYQPIQAEAVPSISAFFAHHSIEEAVPEDEAAVVKATKRKRSRSPTKRDTNEPGQPKPKKSTKKVTIQPPSPLLSPQAVQKRLEKQDILFGTSSQLVRDESPTFIRQIQQAIKESESQLPQDSAIEFDMDNSAQSTRSSLGLIRANRGLWSAGARGDEETVLLSPEILAKDRVQEVVGSAEQPDASDDPLHVASLDGDSAASAEVQVQHISLISSDAIQDIDKIPGLPQSKNLSINLLLDESPPSAQPSSRPNILRDLSTNKKLNLMSHLTVEVGKQSDHKSPQASLRTTKRARSSSPLKKKTVSRPTPIVISSPPAETPPKRATPKDFSHLDKTRATTQPPSSPYHDIDEVETPAKNISLYRLTKTHKPDTPAKPPSSPYHDIDEIEDSEPELTSSPPRRRSPPAVQATLELSPAPAPAIAQVPVASAPTAPCISEWASAIAKVRARAAAEAAAAAAAAAPPASPSGCRSRSQSPSATAKAVKTKAKKPSTKAPKPLKPTASQEAANQAHLFSLITRAVTTAPPGKSLKQPSWYEKMLLYDPIVLEDLAGWLNNGVLEHAAQEDGKRMEVMNGNREHGVQGGMGEGTGMAEMEAIHVKWKVEEKVLQKWCEENSICCLWRGGLRGGVKARY